MPDVFITLEEAAFGSVSYQDFDATHLSQSSVQNEVTGPGGGMRSGVDTRQAPLGKGAEGMAGRAEGGKGSEVIMNQRAQRPCHGTSPPT